MKFSSIDELIRYIVTESIDLGRMDVTFDKKCDCGDKCNCGDKCTCDDKCNCKKDAKKSPEKKEVKENFDVKINTFFDAPLVTGYYGDENILYVESVEGNKDFCGAGRVNVLGREIMTNLCESDGTAYVKLSIDIDGTLLENVSFKLQASDSNTRNTIRIRNNILDE